MRTRAMVPALLAAGLAAAAVAATSFACTLFIAVFCEPEAAFIHVWYCASSSWAEPPSR